MKKHKVHRLPVTVPQCLKHLISSELQEALKVDGHGIAFKENNHIKVIYGLNGEDFGSVFKVSSDKRFDATIKKAMALQQRLRKTYDKAQPQKDRVLGLHIRDEAAKQLPESLVKKLSLDGHGLTVLPNNSIQQRFSRDNVEHGKIYKITDFNSLEELLLTAITNVESLRLKYPATKTDRNPDKGVSLVRKKRVSSNRTSFEAYYAVSYRTNCHRVGIKKFYIGTFHDDISEIPNSWLNHAYKTAKYFRALYCEQMDESVFWGINAKAWKTKKFYKEFVTPKTESVSDSTINNSDTSNSQTQPTFEQGLKHLQSFDL